MANETHRMIAAAGRCNQALPFLAFLLMPCFPVSFLAFLSTVPGLTAGLAHHQLLGCTWEHKKTTVVGLHTGI